MKANQIALKHDHIDHYRLEDLINHSRLSPQVITQSKQYDEANHATTRKTQFLACRVLLADLLAHHYGIEQLPEIIIGENKRPMFADSTLPDFNISHSNGYIAVAIASSGKVGIDIEMQRERKHFQQIAATFFSKIEVDWINQQTSPLDAFWQCWTLRESALKLYAKGVWQMKQITVEPTSLMISASFIEQIYAQYSYFVDKKITADIVSPKVHLSICSDQKYTLVD